MPRSKCGLSDETGNANAAAISAVASDISAVKRLLAMEIKKIYVEKENVIEE